MVVIFMAIYVALMKWIIMVVIRLFRNSIKGGFVCFRQLGVGRIFRAFAGMEGGAGILRVGFLAG